MQTSVEPPTKKLGQLIHVAQITLETKGPRLLFLRKEDPVRFTWYEDLVQEEKETEVFSTTALEAIRLAYLYWKNYSFKTLNCGFRYTLPERDEHGNNALFHQMIASYSSMNGIYFDEDLGHNCFVNFASDEAKNLWKNLQSQKRL
ncbi:MAG: hypothetical protein J0H93_00880 [Chlamydiales bacterium]|nr:hypothetical protein [Chlamydiales bacterium]